MNHGHPLGTRFPNGDGFIDAVPSLIEELPSRLRLRPPVVDGSVDGLVRLDRAAQRIGGQACLDDPHILAPLVAYVGEVIRNVTGGDWAISTAFGQDWQPIIIGPDSRQYPTFGIFKELLERGSMYALVAVTTGCEMHGFVRSRAGIFASREQAVAPARGALATVLEDMYRVTRRYGDGAPWGVSFERDIEIDGFPFAAHTDAWFKRNGDIIGGVLSQTATFQNLTFTPGTKVTFYANHRDGRLGDVVLGEDQHVSSVPCKGGVLTQLRLHKGQPYLAAGTLARDHTFDGIVYPAGTWFSLDRKGHVTNFTPPIPTERSGFQRR
jgi:hypothetical protein